MESILVAVNAVVPFLIVISFGYYVKMTGFVDDGFLKKLNQLIFKFFYPLLMFYNIYQLEMGTIVSKKLVITGVMLLIGAVAVLWCIVPLVVSDRSKCGVIIQAAFRSNFVLFVLPLTLSVYGEENRALPTMMIAFIIPLYNILSVIVLEAFRGGKVQFLSLIKNVCTNPMICGIVAGLIVLLSGVEIPACVNKPLLQFSDLCTPMGMFVLGATLRFERLTHDLKYILPVIFFKLMFMPAIAVAIGLWFGLNPQERFILLAMFATPVSTASYPMAQNMGGDGDLAGELVVISTAGSVITLFFWILLLGNLNLLF